MDQNEQDKKIIADFGISKVKLRDAFINRLDEIETNLKSKFGVDPEHLRLQADFKKQADDYIGYQIGIANKTPEADLGKPYKYRRGRRALKRSAKTTNSPINKFGIHDTMG